jgi:multiple sugar transport system substrate-binding protein
MGMDLIYAPQFENAEQLVDITDQIGSIPELKTASPGHMTVATFNDRLFGVPLYADVSALFYNKTLFKEAGLDPEKPPTSLDELRQYADKITALGDDKKGYYLPGNCAGCNIFTVGPLMWASDATIEAGKCGDEPLVGDGVKAVLQFERDMVKAGNVHDGDRAEDGSTFHLQFGTGKVGMMGTGNFNITLARDQMKDHPFDFGISLLPGTTAGKYASFIGGDLVVVPKGSQRVDDAIAFMKYLLGRDAGGGLREGPEPDDSRRHGRQQVLPGGAARPGRRPSARCRPDAVHADLLRADQLPAGAVAADAAAGVLHGG